MRHWLVKLPTALRPARPQPLPATAHWLKTSGPLNGGFSPVGAPVFFYWAAVLPQDAARVPKVEWIETAGAFMGRLIPVALRLHHTPYIHPLNRMVDELDAARRTHPGCLIYVVHVEKEYFRDRLLRVHLRDDLLGTLVSLRPSELRLEGRRPDPPALRSAD